MSSLLFWSVLVAPVSAAEPEAVCDEEIPEHCSSWLTEGQRAPFTGILLTQALSISLGQNAAYCEEECDLKLAATSSIAAIRLDAEKRVAATDLKAGKEVSFLEGKIEGAAEARDKYAPAFYEHPAFVIPVTMALTIGLLWVTKEIMKLEVVDRR